MLTYFNSLIMKNISSLFSIVFFILSISLVHSQVGVNTQTPDPSAMLDTYSQTKGMLFPRMTTAQKIAINSPAEGLMVYDTSVHSHFIYINGAWVIQRKEFVYPQRNFLIAQSSTALIPTPTAGNSNEGNDQRFAPVNVTMTSGTVSGPQILSNNTSLTIAAAGKYLLKISSRFYKTDSNILNMKGRTILLVNGVNILDTWFHLPNSVNASSTKTNFIVADLAVGDVISVQVKKDRFSSASTASAGLNATFTDIILELEKLPVVN